MEHTWHKCDPPCVDRHCIFCDGGLGYCTVCGGFEGTLPTECPGVEMDQEIQDRIYNSLLDFRDGRWICREPKEFETARTEEEVTLITNMAHMLNRQRDTRLAG